MNFQIVDAALQDELDSGRFAGFNYTVFRRGEVVARRCVDFADLESRKPMRLDHLVRLYFCAKIVTSIAALQRLPQPDRHGMLRSGPGALQPRQDAPECLGLSSGRKRAFAVVAVS